MVVKHIAAGDKPESLALRDLTKRLVVLLTLCNADRASDLIFLSL